MSDKRGRPLDFIQALGDSLYIFMDLREQKSKIIITPDESQQISEVGTIISKGDKVSSDYQVGNKVLIHYFTGTHLQIPECYSSSKYHRMIREHEILCGIDQEKRDRFNQEE